jgi:hypothetical protein
MKDKSFSEFIEPLSMKEGSGIDLTAKLKHCNNTSLEPVSNNLANLNVNPEPTKVLSSLTETSTSSISSTLSSSSSQSQKENLSNQVNCADIHVEIPKENELTVSNPSVLDLTEAEIKVNIFKGLVLMQT